jgi:hypothetical protein
MSLTLGRAPFARPAAGQFNFACALPEHVLYLEDSPRHVRVQFNGHTVADSPAREDAARDRPHAGLLPSGRCLTAAASTFAVIPAVLPEFRAAVRTLRSSR